MLNIKNLSGGMKLNVFLVLLLTALVIISIQKPGLNQQIIYETISSVDNKKIQKVEIISADKKNIIFIKKNQQWHILTKNEDSPIKQSKIGYLLKLVNADSLDNFPVSKDELKQYHLLNPRITVKFDDFVIAFGNSEPLKHRRYILIKQQVHLITDLYYHFLLQPASTYLPASS